jgi:hypothetical protein
LVTVQVLRRQQAAIDKLRKDSENLKAELAMESRHGSTNTNLTSVQSILASLHDQGDLYTQKIEVENRNVKAMDEQIQLLKQKVLYQRKHMGGVNAARENQAMIQKQIRILENRLDKALVKFNEALAHNKQLREEIDNLRRERVVFDNIYRKLERELHDKKKQMANIIELSNLAYEQRDAAQMEVAAIEAQNRKEQEDFEQHMAELGRQIERKRSSDRLENGADRGDMTIADEAKLKTKVNKGAWGIAKEKVAIQVSIEKVQNFEEAFNKIKAATGINDIEELVRTFIKNEDQNFSLFNYVNEQTNEIEKLEEQIQQLKEEEQKYAQESGDDVHQHKQLLRDLELRLQSTESMAERYELKCTEAQKTINSLKMGIHSIFTRIGCASSVGSEILADSNVTEANMMQYLGMIEQRTNEILQKFATVQSAEAESEAASRMAEDDPLADGGGAKAEARAKEAEEEKQATASAAVLQILGMGPATPMGQELLQVDPPNLEDYSSEDESEEEEEDARPLTREELKQKTLKGIHRRANREGHGGGGTKGGGKSKGKSGFKR